MGKMKGTQCGDNVHAKLEMPIRIASGDVVWEDESVNLKLQGQVRAIVRNPEPSTYRWHLSHDPGPDFLARKYR